MVFVHHLFRPHMVANLGHCYQQEEAFNTLLLKILIFQPTLHSYDVLSWIYINGPLGNWHSSSSSPAHTQWQFYLLILSIFEHPQRSTPSAWPLKDSSDSRREWWASRPLPGFAYKPGCLSYSISSKKGKNSSALQFVIGSPLTLIDVFLGQQAFVAFGGPDKDTQMGPLEMGPIVVPFLWRLTNETCGCY